MCCSSDELERYAKKVASGRIPMELREYADYYAFAKEFGWTPKQVDDAPADFIVASLIFMKAETVKIDDEKRRVEKEIERMRSGLW